MPAVLSSNELFQRCSDEPLAHRALPAYACRRDKTLHLCGLISRILLRNRNYVSDPLDSPAAVDNPRARFR
jgi:hypothetical protein